MIVDLEELEKLSTVAMVTDGKVLSSEANKWGLLKNAANV